MCDPGQELGYALPDSALLGADGPAGGFLAWVPPRPCVVIGRGNTVGRSVHAGLAAADGLPLYQRTTGGEAVVLTPDMVAVSVRCVEQPQAPSREYFRRYNGWVKSSLEKLGVAGVCERGTSDLALGERKILGCGLYRNRRAVFYHAVLNVAADPATIERYLQFPARTPDYRRLRPHSDFVTSLAEQGYELTPQAVRDALDAEFGARFHK